MKLVCLAIAAVFIAILLALYMTSGRIEVTKTFTTKRPAAHALRALTDFESIPKWNSSVLESKLLSNQPVRAGTQFMQLRKGLFRNSTMTFTVEKIAGNNTLVVAGKDGSRRVDFEYTLDETPAGSTIRLHFVESPTPLLLSIVLTPLYSRAIDGNMDQLRALIEAASP